MTATQGASTVPAERPPRNGGSAGATFQGRGQSDYYYGKPVVATPVWEAHIPWYFFTGGLAGASSALAFGARVAGNDVLARRAGLAALTGLVPSPILLVWDLGRPSRFLNMLRVFKVTSPMSVGTWLLTVDGAVIALAAVSDVTGRNRPVGRAAEGVAAVLGLGLATYTAVLTADTATPAWHEARRELPFVFAASAAASAGAAAAAVTPMPEAGPARRLAVLGAVAEQAAAALMEHRLGQVGKPYHEGRAGAYSKAAKGLSIAGAAVLAMAGRRLRAVAAGGSALVLAGAVCERFAVFHAGHQSAADPKYTVEAQRRRLEEGRGFRQAEAVGAARAGSPLTAG
jgi:formate-dependent nitrite reductase membrane component NrfD